MQKLVLGSDELSQRPEFKAVSHLKAIDVISVRLWLDRKVDFKYPANVLAGFESQAGSTFFDLNALQVRPGQHSPQIFKARGQAGAFQGALLLLTYKTLMKRWERA